MILFMNVFITSNPLTRVDRGISPYAKRDDVFKYMISSLAGINFSKVYICFEVDEMYSSSVTDIVTHIRSHFPDAVIEPRRLLRVQDWRTFILRTGILDEPGFIFHSGNDDHIFIDKNLTVFDKCMEVAEFCLNTVTPFVSVGYSHWPELMLNWDNIFIHDDNCSAVYVNCLPRESMYISSVELFRQFFFPTGGGLSDEAVIRRTDNLTTVVSGLLVRPHRELLRHFDAYSHVGIPINAFPPLTIPHGYFERDMKLIFDDRSLDVWSDRNPETWTNVSTYSANYRATDPRGAHLKCSKSGLPYHWRGRISDMVDTNDDASVELSLEDLRKAEDIKSVLPINVTTIRRLIPGAFNLPTLGDGPNPPPSASLWAHKYYVGDGGGTAVVLALKYGPDMLGFLPNFMEAFRAFAERNAVELILLVVGTSEGHPKPSFYLTLSHFHGDGDISGIYSYTYLTSSGGCGADPLKLLLPQLPHRTFLILEQKFYSDEINFVTVLDELLTETPTEEVGIFAVLSQGIIADTKVGCGVGGIYGPRSLLHPALLAGRTLNFSTSLIENLLQYIVSSGLDDKTLVASAQLEFVNYKLIPPAFHAWKI